MKRTNLLPAVKIPFSIPLVIAAASLMTVAAPTHADPVQSPPAPQAAEAQRMETRTYQCPDEYPPHYSPDPFESAPMDPASRSAAIKRALEADGIRFPPGSEVDVQGNAVTLTNTPAQLDLVDALMERLHSPFIREVILQVEVISTTPAQYAAAMAADPAGKGLYAWCSDELEKPETKVALEQFCLLRVRSGQRSKAEQVEEYPYPTEYDPPQVPATPVEPRSNPQEHVKESMVPAPATPSTGVSQPQIFPAAMLSGSPATEATPQSFETKNLGFTYEAEVNIGSDGKFVDINHAPDFIKVVRVIPWQVNREIYQPVFQTRKLSGQLYCEMGKPKFAGAMTTPVNVGVAGADAEERMWLVFVTPNPPE